MKTYSVDLREKIVAPVGRGMSKAQAARTFGVDATSVKRYVKLAEQGKPLSLGKAPGKESKLDANAMKPLEEDLHAPPALTHEKRADLLYELVGVRVSKSTICRMVRRLEATLAKKIGGCYRKRRMDQRGLEVAVAGKVDPRELVFVDEMGINTSLSPRYAYSPKGRRARAKVPRNRGANTTLLASMSLKGMGPCLAVEGATTAKVFEAYVERILTPTLRPGQVVVLDNLGAHKGQKVRELIEERGWGYTTCRRTHRTSTRSRKLSRRSRELCEKLKPEPAKP